MMDQHAAQTRTGAMYDSRLALPGRRRGKVRDVYQIPGQATIAIVASDRISAFDVVLPTGIPGKGVVLTEIAAFWLGFIAERGICPTHLVSTDFGDLPPGCGGETVKGRITIGRLCRVLPIEFVVRGYLEGSGWVDYQKTGSVCGVNLPAGLRQCDKLPEPIFTPATKAQDGAHDENIDAASAACVADEIAGEGTTDRLARTALDIYSAASEYARQRGIIIADTKFEFGLPLDARGEPTGEAPILIDEALTPDSSRFWPADRYEPGHSQASYDKQFVREYLLGLIERGEWDKTSPGPELPAEIVAGTLARYTEVRDRLLG